MSVKLPAPIREAMLVHAYNCHPEESCGLLAGEPGGPLRMAYPLTNALHSPTNYTIEPTEHFRALRHAESAGWELVGVFHSHPHTGAYPGWQPTLQSGLLRISKKPFPRLEGREPEIKAIHAGLECGILGGKYPGMDMISFGPTITGAHSPDERVHIPAVHSFYTLLKAVLKAVAEGKF